MGGLSEPNRPQVVEPACESVMKTLATLCVSAGSRTVVGAESDSTWYDDSYRISNPCEGGVVNRQVQLFAVADQRGSLHLGIAYGRYGLESDESTGKDDAELYGVAFLSDTPDAFAPVHSVIDALPLLLDGRWYIPPLATKLHSSVRMLRSEQSSVVEAYLSENAFEGRFATAMGGSQCPRTGEWRLRGATWSIEAVQGSVMPFYYLDLFPDYEYCHWDCPL